MGGKRLCAIPDQMQQQQQQQLQQLVLQRQHDEQQAATSKELEETLRRSLEQGKHQQQEPLQVVPQEPLKRKLFASDVAVAAAAVTAAGDQSF